MSEMSVSGVILLNILLNILNIVFYFSVLWPVYQRLLMNSHQETWKFCLSLLDYFARFPDFFISSGDRGDIGPPGLPVIGTSEQVLQIKGDKGDPGLAGLGGFPGPRGISQYCSCQDHFFSIWARYQWSR